MNASEFRSLTRLSNLTFMEMILLDFELIQSPAEAESAMENLKKNAENRFGLSIQELSDKIQAAFDVELAASLKNMLRRKGNGLDLYKIQDDVNEHKAVLPKFVRKKRVKRTLEDWEDDLKRR